MRWSVNTGAWLHAWGAATPGTMVSGEMKRASVGAGDFGAGDQVPVVSD